MIYDLFTFFNELDLLEIRLNLLSPYVDKFILAEATTTYSGKDKPLFYQKNKDRYAKFNNKIIHVIVDNLPRGKNRWLAEKAQRKAAISLGLTNAADDDVIVISDLDEIWNPQSFPKKINGLIGFRQQAKAFYLNAKHDRIENYSIAIYYSELKKTDIKSLRDKRNYIEYVENGGWHWSYLGGKENIIKKLESFAHSEFDNEKGKSFWVSMGEKQKENCYIPPQSDPDWPQWLKDNWKNYPNLVMI